MPTYLVLCSYTQKGMENVKESHIRLDAAKDAFRAVGAELKEFYLMMAGDCDIVIIAEAPDAETAATLSLSVGSRGAIRARVLRAFTEDEYREIIAALP